MTNFRREEISKRLEDGSKVYLRYKNNILASSFSARFYLDNGNQIINWSDYMTNNLKDLLKDGVVVQLRSGKRYLKIGERLINDKWMPVNNYDDNLSYKEDDEFDIVKIYKCSNSIHSIDVIFLDKYLNLIWERQEYDLSKVPMSELLAELQRRNEDK